MSTLHFLVFIPMRYLRTSDTTFASQLAQLLDRNIVEDDSVRQTVQTIVHVVATNGDDALLHYTNQLDDRHLQTAQDAIIEQSTLHTAKEQLDKGLLNALEVAKQRITAYHEKQIESSWQFEDNLGVQLGQRIQPLETVGLYVPGGKAAYPSSVLMNAIPAHIAGVKRIIACVPTPQNKTSQAVLAALALAEVDAVFSFGGAQAIAALAYGTNTVPQVDKIVGPGNAYVAEAKRQVFGRVGIDMIAGPSEVLIVADTTANPKWVALDMCAQAEHDEHAQALLVTPDEAFAQQVEQALKELMQTQVRNTIIQKSLDNMGAFIITTSLTEAIDVANQIAPEHLELAFDEADNYLDLVKHAGAIFVGHMSAESLGDYCFGPNHVLPTSGCARFASPLGVYDFVTRTSIIRCPHNASQKLAPVAATIAKAEGLQAHMDAANVRMTPHSS